MAARNSNVKSWPSSNIVLVEAESEAATQGKPTSEGCVNVMGTYCQSETGLLDWDCYGNSWLKLTELLDWAETVDGGQLFVKL